MPTTTVLNLYVQVGILTFPSINVIEVVEGVLHDAVTHFTEISVNSKDSKDGTVEEVELARRITHAYVHTYNNYGSEQVTLNRGKSSF